LKKKKYETYAKVFQVVKYIYNYPLQVSFIEVIFKSEYDYGKSSDSSVGIATRLRAGRSGSMVRFSAGAGNFYLHNRLQNGSGARPASYPVGTMGSFPGSKAAGA
jgi:hypothetical protein